MNPYFLSALIGYQLLASEIFLLKSLSSLSGLGEGWSNLAIPFLFFAVAVGQLAVTLFPRVRSFAAAEPGTLLSASILLLSAVSPDLFDRSAWSSLNFLPFALGFILLILLGAAQGAMYLNDGWDRTRLTVAFSAGLVAANSTGFLLEICAVRHLLFFCSLFALAASSAIFRNRVQHAMNLICTLLLLFVTEPWKPISPSALSNSFSSLEVFWAGDARVVNPNSTGGVRAEFALPDSSQSNLFLIRRNQNRPVQIFDLNGEGDLDVLEQYPQSAAAMAFMEQAEKGRAALVGTGGGREILLARKAGFREISALEINPLMIEASRRFSRHPELTYDAANVTVRIGDARGDLERSHELQELDLITMISVRSYGRGLGRMFAENSLLTRESFRTFTMRLNAGGTFLFGRHGSTSQDRSIVGAALEAFRSAARPGDEVAWVHNEPEKNRWRGQPGQDLFLAFKRGGYSVEQKAVLTRRLNEFGFQIEFRDGMQLQASAFLPGFHEGEVSTDDRPYPSANRLLRLRAGGGLWMVLAALVFLVMVSARRTGAAFSPGFAAAALGFGTMGMQMIVLAKAVFAFGHPGLLPSLLMTGFAVFGMLGYARELQSPSPDFSRPMLESAVVSAFSLGILSMGFSIPGDWAAILPVCICTSISGYFSARAFAVLLRLAPQEIGKVLFHNGLGSLLGGLTVKVLAVCAGYTVAAGVCGFVLALPWILRKSLSRSEATPHPDVTPSGPPVPTN